MPTTCHMTAEYVLMLFICFQGWHCPGLGQASLAALRNSAWQTQSPTLQHYPASHHSPCENGVYPQKKMATLIGERDGKPANLVQSNWRHLTYLKLGVTIKIGYPPVFCRDPVTPRGSQNPWAHQPLPEAAPKTPVTCKFCRNEKIKGCPVYKEC